MQKKSRGEGEEGVALGVQKLMVTVKMGAVHSTQWSTLNSIFWIIVDSGYLTLFFI